MYRTLPNHITVNRLATALRVHHELILGLCEANGIAVVSCNGTRFLRLADVAPVTLRVQAWLVRPILRLHARRKFRPRRTSPTPRERWGTGEAAAIAFHDRKVSRLYPKQSGINPCT